MFNSRSVSDPNDSEVWRETEEYDAISRAYVTLRDQRDQALKSMAVLHAARAAALSNPKDFLEQLEEHVGNGCLSAHPSLQAVSFPPRQVIAPVPPVDISIYMKPMPGTPLSRSRNWSSKSEDSDPESFDEPGTIGRAWAADEHSRFLLLLDAYPDDVLGNRRWRRIADALGGGRTARQVASHGHKVLAKMARERAQQSELTIQTRRQLATQPYAIDTVLTATLMTAAASLTPTVPDLLALHDGFCCDSCGCEPIVGPRYCCVECPDPGVDLCTACAKGSRPVPSANHDSSHALFRLDIPEIWLPVPPPEPMVTEPI